MVTLSQNSLIQNKMEQGMQAVGEKVWVQRS
jgi:hypothetical protein